MRRLLPLLALASVAILAAFTAPTPARVAPAMAPGDTVQVTAHWPAACDALGCASSYVVRWEWTFGNFQTTQTVTDTLAVWPIALPTFPDSTRVRVVVHSIRRGLTSTDSTVVIKWYKRNEGFPPAPSPVVLTP